LHVDGTPSPEEMKSLLTEYCEELLNTANFKKDAKAGYESVYKEWAKNYADDKWAKGKELHPKLLAAEEAFTKAKKEGKLVFLSIGYKIKNRVQMKS